MLVDQLPRRRQPLRVSQHQSAREPAQLGTEAVAQAGPDVVVGLGQRVEVLRDRRVDLVPIEPQPRVLRPEGAPKLRRARWLSAPEDLEGFLLRVDREENLLLDLAAVGVARPVDDRELVPAPADVGHGVVPVVARLCSQPSITFRFESEEEPSRPLRLEIEINTREHGTRLGYHFEELVVASRWFTGRADIRSFPERVNDFETGAT